MAGFDGASHDVILGVTVSGISLASLVERVQQAVHESGPPLTVVCANPHSIVVSRYDKLFHEALKSASVVVPDGTGVVLLSRLRGGGLRRRITGSDFFQAVSRAFIRPGGTRHFFLGSNPTTLERLQARCTRDFPAVVFAGSYAPPYSDSFSEEENEQMIDAVNSSHADVLWVGMTAPKQEKWIAQNAARLNVKVIGAVGAVFDYFAGTVRRPAPAWRALGLEWLPRLAREPRRLWRRNLVSTPKFLLLAALERTRRGRV